MTPAELATASALGASLLTGLASLGVMWLQQWLQGRASDRAALAASARELLSRSLAVAMRARVMGDTMKSRSGLKEGLDVTLRQRKPVDPLELHDWMARDLAPLNAALSEIWTRDNQEGVRLANDVVNKCAVLLSASTARQQADGWKRARVWAAGEQWTPEMTKAYDSAMRELARARKDYADHARARFGLDAVELFTSAEAHETPNAIEGGKTHANRNRARYRE
ncbi:MAG TPA: hypothetical protein VFO01_11460 [Trebonia sp.]|nr:hypothetical protein [Trebonia sp.]